MKNQQKEIEKTKKMIPLLRINKKGDLEFDEIGKLIIALVLLIILIIIVTVYIKGEFSDQESNFLSIFNLF